MKENIEEDISAYFDDKSLIEDDFYSAIKNLIKCKYCHNLLKEPMMCTKCQGAYCRNCIEELGNEEHACENPEYDKNLNAISLIGQLKYLCKNCKAEIKKADIEKHIKEGCIRNEKSSQLINELYRKQTLRKLKKDEIKTLSDQNKNVNHISSKSSFLIFNQSFKFLLQLCY